MGRLETCNRRTSREQEILTWNGQWTDLSIAALKRWGFTHPYHQWVQVAHRKEVWRDQNDLELVNSQNWAARALFSNSVPHCREITGRGIDTKLDRNSEVKEKKSLDKSWRGEQLRNFRKQAIVTHNRRGSSLKLEKRSDPSSLLEV